MIFFFSSSKFFLIENKTFKETLRYHFDDISLLNTVFYLVLPKLNFNLKIHPKTCNFINLKENLKIQRKFSKTI